MNAVPPLRRLLVITGLACWLWVWLAPALFNGFPLIFPDSGTNLGIGFGHEYAIYRSSIYGFLLKPFVTLIPTLVELWPAGAAQCVVLAAILWPGWSREARSERRRGLR